MELFREEILPGVWLTALGTDKFKTGVLSVSLLTQLKAETAAMNALIPSVLRRGTVSLPDMESISAYLEELYGAVCEPVVRKTGEVQSLGFLCSFPEDGRLPGRERVTEKVCALVGELLLQPNTRGGLLLPEYVSSERDKLAERIRGEINNKQSYAMQRLIENMCAFEDFAVSRLGSEESAKAVYYTKLTKHYKALLETSPIEIFYCGSAKPEALRTDLRRALEILPRGEIDWDIGTDIRMNAIEEQPRSFTDALDVTQGKLGIGWRLGDSMDEPDQAVLRVFNAVFGGGINSKLFLNVRERLSLCYYAYSAIDMAKGLLLVGSGVEFDKFDAAKDEIFAQFDAVKRGEITDGELDCARRTVASDLREIMDDPMQLERFWLGQNLLGEDAGPLELAAACESVTKEQVVAAATACECDAVYFMKGEDAEDDED